MKRISLKKILAALLLAIFCWQFYAAQKSLKTASGESSLFGVSRLIIGADLVLSRHQDVEEMISGSYAIYYSYLQLVWPEATCCFQRQEKMASAAVIEEDKSKTPMITFYYEQQTNSRGGGKVKVLTAIHFNWAFLQEICCGMPLKIRDLRSDGGLVAHANKWANDAKRVTESSLRKIDPEENYRLFRHVDFSPEELRSLATFGVGMKFLCFCTYEALEALNSRRHCINYEYGRECIWLEQKTLARNAFAAYSQRFIDEFPFTTCLYTWKIRFLAFGLMAVILDLLLHLIRRDVYAVLKEDLRQLGVTATNRMVLRLMLTNWRFLIFTPSAKRMEPVIRQACQQIRDRQIDAALRAQARSVWRWLGRVNNARAMLGEYRIACGQGRHSLAKRERSLWQLTDGLIRLEQKTGKIKFEHQLPREAVPTRKVKAEHIERELTLNERLRRLLEAEPPQLSSNALMENLASTVLCLKAIHPQAVGHLLESDKLELLLKSRSPLMLAVKAGDTEIIREILDLKKAAAKAKPRTKADYSCLLAGKKTAVIGGEKAVSKSAMLCEVLCELGAEEAVFLNSREDAKISAAALAAKTGNHCLFIVIASSVDHSVQEILSREGCRFIFVNRFGKDRFRDEVINACKG